MYNKCSLIFVETSILKSLFWNELMELVFGSSNSKFIYTEQQKKTRASELHCLGIPSTASLSDYKASARLLPETENSPPQWGPIIFSVRSNR